jgi:hypothetical protein
MIFSTLTIFLLVVAIAVLSVFGLVTYGLNRSKQKEEFIRTYKFPIGLFAKLRFKHPHLSQKDCMLVSRAMRKYFLTYLKGQDFVAMPSQVVDDFWHEFILYTREYQMFCKAAFGRFMHHTPVVKTEDVQQSILGLRRCWMWACREETINPFAPLRLPLLFAIDAKLNIEGGFRYEEGEELLRKLGLNGRRSDGSVSAGCGGGGANSGSTWGDAGSSDGGGSSGSSGCGGGGCGGS